jgi:FlaA1/EpsC-like NDP-sugar epimerase
VTHREARRFFLTVGEVTQLLGEAMTSDAAGVLIPDPGEALPIAELARRMMAASGRDVEMVFTEPRPGDKLDERLMAEEERDGGAATAGLRHVLSAATDVDEQMSALSAAVAARDVQAALRVVRELVPDYRPSAALQDALEARV